MKTQQSIDTRNDVIADLISIAISEHNRASIVRMLKIVAERFDACGCILWQVAPSRDVAALSKSGNLFVLAEWFQNNKGTAIHDLPFDSATGNAIRTGTPFNDNVWDESNGVINTDPLFKQADVKIMCSIPISFRNRSQDSEYTISGALNLYRNRDEAFTNSELTELQRVGELLPVLYQNAWDNEIHQFINKIGDLLNAAQRQTPRIALSERNIKRITRRICELIAETLHCGEVSIFLQNDLSSSATYDLSATTWTGKKLASATKGKGLLGWVLENARHVRIFDLASFERDRLRFYQETYPGITFKANDALDVPTIRHIMGIGREVRLPKLSLIAVPIMEGLEVLGAIRCSIAKEGPFYFAEAEVELVNRVATHLGRYLVNWLERRRLRYEVQSWHAFAESVGKLDAFVRTELKKDELSEARIFEEALKDTEELIRGADITDVRLFDRATRELYYLAPRGKAWNEGPEDKVIERRNRRFSVDGPLSSAGARVFNNGEVELLNDVHLDPHYSEIFPNTKRMIIAPIRIGSEVYGILDIRGTEDDDFPAHAEAVAKLLGERLGLYCLLVATIRVLRNRDKDLEETVRQLDGTHEQQRHVLEDLNHQLYGPITEAHGVVQDLLRREFEELVRNGQSEDLLDRLGEGLLALRGLCGKTKRVTMSTGLFADLEIQEPEGVKLSRLRSKLKLKRMVRELRADRKNPDDIYKKLMEAAKDGHSLIEQDRKIEVRIRKDSFNVLLWHEIYVDYDLLEQAIVNLLDNAFKYSDARSEIRIEGGLTKTQRFYISISNRGIPIPDGETEFCKHRGWRGNNAKRVIGEGSGIGLWIVDYIMKAHHGHLEITCKKIDEKTGITRIRLVFSELDVEPMPKSDLYRLVGLKQDQTKNPGSTGGPIR